MTTNEAREYFKSKGLSYTDITEGELLILITLITKELKKYKKEGGQLKLTLSLKTDIKKNTNNTIKEFYLFCNGGYFVKREAISFNRDGFIGFAGWASSSNVKPFISAFIKWCDIMEAK